MNLILSNRVIVKSSNLNELQVLQSSFLTRFGKITKVDYTEGEYHAYVMYESLDAASAALSEMKGYPLGGADHRITVDFADPGKAGRNIILL